METMFGGAGINSRKPLRRPGKLVAADAEGNHISIMKLDGEIEHALRLLGSELPYGVEDPEQGNAEVLLAALAAAFQPFKNGGKILLAPEADADRNNNLGMAD